MRSHRLGASKPCKSSSNRPTRRAVASKPTNRPSKPLSNKSLGRPSRLLTPSPTSPTFPKHLIPFMKQSKLFSLTQRPFQTRQISTFLKQNPRRAFSSVPPSSSDFMNDSHDAEMFFNSILDQINEATTTENLISHSQHTANQALQAAAESDMHQIDTTDPSHVNNDVSTKHPEIDSHLVQQFDEAIYHAYQTCMDIYNTTGNRFELMAHVESHFGYLLHSAYEQDSTGVIAASVWKGLRQLPIPIPPSLVTRVISHHSSLAAASGPAVEQFLSFLLASPVIILPSHIIQIITWIAASGVSLTESSISLPQLIDSLVQSFSASTVEFSQSTEAQSYIQHTYQEFLQTYPLHDASQPSHELSSTLKHLQLRSTRGFLSASDVLSAIFPHILRAASYDPSHALFPALVSVAKSYDVAFTPDMSFLMVHALAQSHNFLAFQDLLTAAPKSFTIHHFNMFYSSLPNRMLRYPEIASSLAELPATLRQLEITPTAETYAIFIKYSSQQNQIANARQLYYDVFVHKKIRPSAPKHSVPQMLSWQPDAMRHEESLLTAIDITVLSPTQQLPLIQDQITPISSPPSATPTDPAVVESDEIIASQHVQPIAMDQYVVSENTLRLLFYQLASQDSIASAYQLFLDDIQGGRRIISSPLFQQLIGKVAQHDANYAMTMFRDFIAQGHVPGFSLLCVLAKYLPRNTENTAMILYYTNLILDRLSIQIDVPAADDAAVQDQSSTTHPDLDISPVDHESQIVPSGTNDLINSSNLQSQIVDSRLRLLANWHQVGPELLHLSENHIRLDHSDVQSINQANVSNIPRLMECVQHAVSSSVPASTTSTISTLVFPHVRFPIFPEHVQHRYAQHRKEMAQVASQDKSAKHPKVPGTFSRADVDHISGTNPMTYIDPAVVESAEHPQSSASSSLLLTPSHYLPGIGTYLSNSIHSPTSVLSGFHRVEAARSTHHFQDVQRVDHQTASTFSIRTPLRFTDGTITSCDTALPAQGITNAVLAQFNESGQDSVQTWQSMPASHIGTPDGLLPHLLRVPCADLLPFHLFTIRRMCRSLSHRELTMLLSSINAISPTLVLPTFLYMRESFAEFNHMAALNAFRRYQHQLHQWAASTYQYDMAQQTAAEGSSSSSSDQQHKNYEYHHLIRDSQQRHAQQQQHVALFSPIHNDDEEDENNSAVSSSSSVSTSDSSDVTTPQIDLSLPPQSLPPSLDHFGEALAQYQNQVNSQFPTEMPHSSWALLVQTLSSSNQLDILQRKIQIAVQNDPSGMSSLDNALFHNQSSTSTFVPIPRDSITLPNALSQTLYTLTPQDNSQQTSPDSSIVDSSTLLNLEHLYVRLPPSHKSIADHVTIAIGHHSNNAELVVNTVSQRFVQMLQHVPKVAQSIVEHLPTLTQSANSPQQRGYLLHQILSQYNDLSSAYEITSLLAHAANPSTVAYPSLKPFQQHFNEMLPRNSQFSQLLSPQSQSLRLASSDPSSLQLQPPSDEAAAAAAAAESTTFNNFESIHALNHVPLMNIVGQLQHQYTKTTTNDDNAQQFRLRLQTLFSAIQHQIEQQQTSSHPSTSIQSSPTSPDPPFASPSSSSQFSPNLSPTHSHDPRLLGELFQLPSVAQPVGKMPPLASISTIDLACNYSLQSSTETSEMHQQKPIVALNILSSVYYLEHQCLWPSLFSLEQLSYSHGVVISPDSILSTFMRKLNDMNFVNTSFLHSTTGGGQDSTSVTSQLFLAARAHTTHSLVSPDKTIDNTLLYNAVNTGLTASRSGTLVNKLENDLVASLQFLMSRLVRLTKFSQYATLFPQKSFKLSALPVYIPADVIKQLKKPKKQSSLPEPVASPTPNLTQGSSPMLTPSSSSIPSFSLELESTQLDPNLADFARTLGMTFDTDTAPENAASATTIVSKSELHVAEALPTSINKYNPFVMHIPHNSLESYVKSQFPLVPLCVTFSSKPGGIEDHKEPRTALRSRSRDKLLVLFNIQAKTPAEAEAALAESLYNQWSTQVSSLLDASLQGPILNLLSTARHSSFPLLISHILDVLNSFNLNLSCEHVELCVNALAANINSLPRNELGTFSKTVQFKSTISAVQKLVDTTVQNNYSLPQPIIHKLVGLVQYTPISDGTTKKWLDFMFATARSGKPEDIFTHDVISAVLHSLITELRHQNDWLKHNGSHSTKNNSSMAFQHHREFAQWSHHIITELFQLHLNVVHRQRQEQKRDQQLAKQSALNQSSHQDSQELDDNEESEMAQESSGLFKYTRLLRSPLPSEQLLTVNELLDTKAMLQNEGLLGETHFGQLTRLLGLSEAAETYNTSWNVLEAYLSQRRAYNQTEELVRKRSYFRKRQHYMQSFYEYIKSQTLKNSALLTILTSPDVDFATLRHAFGQLTWFRNFTGTNSLGRFMVDTAPATRQWRYNMRAHGEHRILSTLVTYEQTLPDIEKLRRPEHFARSFYPAIHLQRDQRTIRVSRSEKPLPLDERCVDADIWCADLSTQEQTPPGFFFLSKYELDTASPLRRMLAPGSLGLKRLHDCFADVTVQRVIKSASFQYMLYQHEQFALNFPDSASYNDFYHMFIYNNTRHQTSRQLAILEENFQRLQNGESLLESEQDIREYAQKQLATSHKTLPFFTPKQNIVHRRDVLLWQDVSADRSPSSAFTSTLQKPDNNDEDDNDDAIPSNLPNNSSSSTSFHSSSPTNSHLAQIQPTLLLPTGRPLARFCPVPCSYDTEDGFIAAIATVKEQLSHLDDVFFHHNRDDAPTVLQTEYLSDSYILDSTFQPLSFIHKQRDMLLFHKLLTHTQHALSGITTQPSSTFIQQVFSLVLFRSSHCATLRDAFDLLRENNIPLDHHIFHVIFGALHRLPIAEIPAAFLSCTNHMHKVFQPQRLDPFGRESHHKHSHHHPSHSVDSYNARPVKTEAGHVYYPYAPYDPHDLSFISTVDPLASVTLQMVQDTTAGTLVPQRVSLQSSGDSITGTPSDESSSQSRHPQTPSSHIGFKSSGHYYVYKNIDVRERLGFIFKTLEQEMSSLPHHVAAREKYEKYMTTMVAQLRTKWRYASQYTLPTSEIPISYQMHTLLNLFLHCTRHKLYIPNYTFELLLKKSFEETNPSAMTLLGTIYLNMTESFARHFAQRPLRSPPLSDQSSSAKMSPLTDSFASGSSSQPKDSDSSLSQNELNASAPIFGTQDISSLTRFSEPSEYIPLKTTLNTTRDVAVQEQHLAHLTHVYDKYFTADPRIQIDLDESALPSAGASSLTNPRQMTRQLNRVRNVYLRQMYLSSSTNQLHKLFFGLPGAQDILDRALQDVARDVNGEEIILGAQVIASNPQNGPVADHEAKVWLHQLPDYTGWNKHIHLRAIHPESNAHSLRKNSRTFPVLNAALEPEDGIDEELLATQKNASEPASLQSETSSLELRQQAHHTQRLLGSGEAPARAALDRHLKMLASAETDTPKHQTVSPVEGQTMNLFPSERSGIDIYGVGHASFSVVGSGANRTANGIDSATDGNQVVDVDPVSSVDNSEQLHDVLTAQFSRDLSLLDLTEKIQFRSNYPYHSPTTICGVYSQHHAFFETFSQSKLPIGFETLQLLFDHCVSHGNDPHLAYRLYLFLAQHIGPSLISSSLFHQAIQSSSASLPQLIRRNVAAGFSWEDFAHEILPYYYSSTPQQHVQYTNDQLKYLKTQFHQLVAEQMPFFITELSLCEDSDSSNTREESSSATVHKQSGLVLDSSLDPSFLSPREFYKSIVAHLPGFLHENASSSTSPLDGMPFIITDPTIKAKISPTMSKTTMLQQPTTSWWVTNDMQPASPQRGALLSRQIIADHIWRYNHYVPTAVTNALVQSLFFSRQLASQGAGLLIHFNAQKSLIVKENALYMRQIRSKKTTSLPPRPIHAFGIQQSHLSAHSLEAMLFALRGIHVTLNATEADATQRIGGGEPQRSITGTINGSPGAPATTATVTAPFHTFADIAMSAEAIDFSFSENVASSIKTLQDTVRSQLVVNSLAHRLPRPDSWTPGRLRQISPDAMVPIAPYLDPFKSVEFLTAIFSSLSLQNNLILSDFVIEVQKRINRTAPTNRTTLLDDILSSLRKHSQSFTSHSSDFIPASYESLQHFLRQDHSLGSLVASLQDTLILSQDSLITPRILRPQEINAHVYITPGYYAGSSVSKATLSVNYITQLDEIPSRGLGKDRSSPNIPLVFALADATALGPNMTTDPLYMLEDHVFPNPSQTTNNKEAPSGASQGNLLLKNCPTLQPTQNPKHLAILASRLKKLELLNWHAQELLNANIMLMIYHCDVSGNPASHPDHAARALHFLSSLPAAVSLLDVTPHIVFQHHDELLPPNIDNLLSIVKTLAVQTDTRASVDSSSQFPFDAFPSLSDLYITPATYNTILAVTDAYVDRLTLHQEQAVEIFDSQMAEAPLHFASALSNLRQTLSKSDETLSTSSFDNTALTNWAITECSAHIKQTFVLDFFAQFKQFIFDHGMVAHQFANDCLRGALDVDSPQENTRPAHSSKIQRATHSGIVAQLLKVQEKAVVESACQFVHDTALADQTSQAKPTASLRRIASDSDGEVDEPTFFSNSSDASAISNVTGSNEMAIIRVAQQNGYNNSQCHAFTMFNSRSNSTLANCAISALRKPFTFQLDPDIYDEETSIESTLSKQRRRFQNHTDIASFQKSWPRHAKSVVECLVRHSLATQGKHLSSQLLANFVSHRHFLPMLMDIKVHSSDIAHLRQIFFSASDVRSVIDLAIDVADDTKILMDSTDDDHNLDSQTNKSASSSSPEPSDPVPAPSLLLSPEISLSDDQQDQAMAMLETKQSTSALLVPLGIAKHLQSSLLMDTRNDEPSSTSSTHPTCISSQSHHAANHLNRPVTKKQIKHLSPAHIGMYLMSSALSGLVEPVSTQQFFKRQHLREQQIHRVAELYTDQDVSSTSSLPLAQLGEQSNVPTSFHITDLSHTAHNATRAIIRACATSIEPTRALKQFPDLPLPRGMFYGASEERLPPHLEQHWDITLQHSLEMFTAADNIVHSNTAHRVPSYSLTIPVESASSHATLQSSSSSPTPLTTPSSSVDNTPSISNTQEINPLIGKILLSPSEIIRTLANALHDPERRRIAKTEYAAQVEHAAVLDSHSKKDGKKKKKGKALGGVLFLNKQMEIAALSQRQQLQRIGLSRYCCSELNITSFVLKDLILDTEALLQLLTVDLDFQNLPHQHQQHRVDNSEDTPQLISTPKYDILEQDSDLIDAVDLTTEKRNSSSHHISQTPRRSGLPEVVDLKDQLLADPSSEPMESSPHAVDERSAARQTARDAGVLHHAQLTKYPYAPSSLISMLQQVANASTTVHNPTQTPPASSSFNNELSNPDHPLKPVTVHYVQSLLSYVVGLVHYSTTIHHTNARELQKLTNKRLQHHQRLENIVSFAGFVGSSSNRKSAQLPPSPLITRLQHAAARYLSRARVAVTISVDDYGGAQILNQTLSDVSGLLDLATADDNCDNPDQAVSRRNSSSIRLKDGSILHLNPSQSKISARQKLKGEPSVPSLDISHPGKHTLLLPVPGFFPMLFMNYCITRDLSLLEQELQQYSNKFAALSARPATLQEVLELLDVPIVMPELNSIPPPTTESAKSLSMCPASITALNPSVLHLAQMCSPAALYAFGVARNKLHHMNWLASLADDCYCRLQPPLLSLPSRNNDPSVPTVYISAKQSLSQKDLRDQLEILVGLLLPNSPAMMYENPNALLREFGSSLISTQPNSYVVPHGAIPSSLEFTTYQPIAQPHPNSWSFVPQLITLSDDQMHHLGSPETFSAIASQVPSLQSLFTIQKHIGYTQSSGASVNFTTAKLLLSHATRWMNDMSPATILFLFMGVCASQIALLPAAWAEFVQSEQQQQRRLNNSSPLQLSPEQITALVDSFASLVTAQLHLTSASLPYGDFVSNLTRRATDSLRRIKTVTQDGATYGDIVSKYYDNLPLRVTSKIVLAQSSTLSSVRCREPATSSSNKSPHTPKHHHAGSKHGKHRRFDDGDDNIDDGSDNDHASNPDTIQVSAAERFLHEMASLHNFINIARGTNMCVSPKFLQHYIRVMCINIPSHLFGYQNSRNRHLLAERTDLLAPLIDSLSTGMVGYLSALYHDGLLDLSLSGLGTALGVSAMDDDSAAQAMDRHKAIQFRHYRHSLQHRRQALEAEQNDQHGSIHISGNNSQHQPPRSHSDTSAHRRSLHPLTSPSSLFSVQLAPRELLLINELHSDVIAFDTRAALSLLGQISPDVFNFEFAQSYDYHHHTRGNRNPLPASSSTNNKSAAQQQKHSVSLSTSDPSDITALLNMFWALHTFRRQFASFVIPSQGQAGDLLNFCNAPILDVSRRTYREMTVGSSAVVRLIDITTRDFELYYYLVRCMSICFPDDPRITQALIETVEEISSITRDSDRIVNSIVFGEHSSQEWFDSARNGDSNSMAHLSAQSNRAKTLDYAGASAQLHPTTNIVSRDLIFRAEALEMMIPPSIPSKPVTPWFKRN